MEPNPDVDQDALRRDAADIDVEHRLAMPRLRDALSRIFSGETAATPDERARAVLGWIGAVPSSSVVWCCWAGR